MRRRFLFRSFLILLLAFTLIWVFVKEPEKSQVAGVTKRAVPDQTVVAGMLSHYWDDFNFADTAAVKNPNVGEQKLVNFLAALSKVPDSLSPPAITKMLSKAKAHSFAFDYFTRQYEHYLYDPNSPMRRDAAYEPVLQFLLDSCQLDEASRFRYLNRLELAKKNKVNTRALDFEFLLPAGSKSSLYNTDAPFTLLFFYEPDCRHCQDAIVQLRDNQALRKLVDKQQLNILAVYAGGNKTVWEDYQKQIPSNWTNGFDWKDRIRREQLYDIKASPTIYLLGKHRRVILKDAGLPEIAMILINA